MDRDHHDPQAIGALHRALSRLAPYRPEGRLRRSQGMLVSCTGLSGLAAIGDTCLIEQPAHNCDEWEVWNVSPLNRLAEVVGVGEDLVHLLPFDDVRGTAC